MGRLGSVVRAVLWKRGVMWAGRGEVGFQEACGGHLATDKTGEGERRA